MSAAAPLQFFCERAIERNFSGIVLDQFRCLKVDRKRRIGLTALETRSAEMNKRIPLEQLTVPDLVQCFLSTTHAQYEAELRSETGKYNRLYRHMREIEDELKNREGDQRRALLPFLNHANVQVRLMAAGSLLAIVPARAKKALETVRDSRIVPQSVSAGFLLDGTEDGSFVPK
jgi:hypothetical protein